MRPILLVVLLLGMAQVKGQDRLRIHGVSMGGQVLEVNENWVVFLTKTGDTLQLGADSFRFTLQHIGDAGNLHSSKIKTAQPDDRLQFSQNKHVFGQLEMSMVVRNSPETVVKPSLAVAVLYRPFLEIYTGGGIGMDLYDDVRLTSAFGRISAHISNQVISPYVEMSGGYSWATLIEKPDFDTGFDPSAKGGIRFHPKFGFKLVDRMSTIFTFGMLYQKMSKETGFLDWRGNPIVNRETLKLNMATFGLSFVF